jgi:hypothetical protein
MSEEQKISESLEKKMVPGKRYRIADLVEMLPITDYHFSAQSNTPNNSEPNRPRWNRWVRNTVRNSPGRTDHPTNWWSNLKSELVGPSSNDWDYWIENSESAIHEFVDSTKPEQNDGWLAEQRVLEWCRNNNWIAHDVSRDGVGYDILAINGAVEMFIEVKSSTSSLSLALTQNEWETAKKNGDKYLIAYFENFDPNIVAEPKWIMNPAKITPNIRHFVEFHLPKDQWYQ